MNAVVLAHQPEFAFGPLRVCPETRSVVRDGREEILEPRVMQVLVVLAQADGHVVARDDLVERCWSGRIVGDDSIHRVISRLRRLAEGPGRDVFTIETVTKVGYRLRRLDGSAPVEVGQSGLDSHPSSRALISRRRLLVGGGLAAAAIGSGGWWWARHANGSAPNAEAQALFEQARLGLAQSTREGQSQSGAILRQLVERYPDYADAWGSLALTYALTSHFSDSVEARRLRRRALAAAARALALDPGNDYALVAKTMARPYLGNWFVHQQELAALLQSDGDNRPALRSLALSFGDVGRNQQGATMFERVAASGPPTPATTYQYCQSLWRAGRLDETDAALRRAANLYPTHFAIWFARFYAALYSGRPAAALALAADTASRPSDIPDSEIEAVVAVAKAAISRAPQDIDGVMKDELVRAREGAGHAENAIQFAVLLGRPAIAMKVLRAYYFNEGFVVPELRYARSVGTFTPRDDRLTHFLFAPSIAPMHGSAPFRALTRRLGLDDYWRRSATKLSRRGVPVD